MRIWHVYASNRLGPVNGVVQSIHQLAAAQRAIGMDVHELHGTDDDPHHGPASGTGRGLLREAAALEAIAPPDLIHLHELFRPPHLRLRRQLRRTPYVVTTHGATAAPNLARYRWRKAAYGRGVERRLVRGADALVALTIQERRDLYAWLPRAPEIRVIPNVADPTLLALPSWHPPAPDPHPRPTVVSLARWDVRHKGLDRISELATRLPSVSFAVHGAPCGNEPAALEGLRAAAPANFSLVPAVHGEAKIGAMRAASVFILMSRWEGLAMALLEAMALGLPCAVSEEVAATLGHAAPVIRLPADADQAATALAAFIADEPRRRATGRAGRKWVRSMAAPEVIAAQTEELYRSVLTSTASDRRSRARR